MKKDKKKTLKIAVLITSIFIIFMSVSYAFINLTLSGTKKQVIVAGTLSLVLDEDENNLTIQNALPMYDEVGMLQEAFTFRLINNGDYAANYKLTLTEIGTGTLEKSDVKYALTKDGQTTIDLLSNLKYGIIDSGTIGASPETIEYELRLWIRDDITDNTAIIDKSITYRVDVEINQEREKLQVMILGQEFGYEETTSTFPDFTQIANAINNNGDGIYKYQEDGEDIYYWRGAVEDNNVIFAGYCWQMVRTTKTGGIKMIYNGEVVEPVTDENGNVIGGKCTNTGSSSQLPNQSAFGKGNESLANVGYMYGNTIYKFRYKYTSDEALTTPGVKYGYDVEWKIDEETGEEVYELKSKVGGSLYETVGVWSTDYASIANANHYTCFNTTGKCSTVHYVYYANSVSASSKPYYIELTGGTKIEKALEQMYSNEQSSRIKEKIETWFAGSNLAKAENLAKIEDVVYCNDRSSSNMAGWSIDGDATQYMYYSASTRSTNGTPDLNCRNREDNRDRFTYQDTTNGNGLLEWPVGLLTTDEIVLAGGQSTPNSDYYLYSGVDYWLLSPQRFTSSLAHVFYIYNGGRLTNTTTYRSLGIRPAISIASTTTFATGGEGTKTNPYVVQ